MAKVVPLLLLVTIIAFGLLNLVPGDPAVQIAGEFATPEQVERIRNDLGLDRPWVERYADWLANAVQGDLGDSLFAQVPVRTQLWQRLPATISLIGWSLVLSAVIGIPAGTIAGWREGSRLDRVLTVFTTVGVAIPVFVSGLLLALYLGLKLGWFPATGYVSLTESPWQWARHMVLPAFALSLTGAAEIARQTRAGVIQVKKQDFVRSARANGLRTRQVLGRHTLKNAMIPVVTVLGLQISRMFGLSVLIEQFFNIPGLGSRLITAVFENDVPFIQGTVLVLGVVIVLVNATVDISYGYFNPRIRDQ
jgi:peptide/nickel transport system permease protein